MKWAASSFIVARGQELIKRALHTLLIEPGNRVGWGGVGWGTELLFLLYYRPSDMILLCSTLHMYYFNFLNVFNVVSSKKTL